MNKYVFLQPAVCGMGGAQQYLYRKINFLKQLEWDVVVISNDKGEILIEDLKSFSEMCVDGIRYSTCYYRKSDISKMVDEAISLIKPQENEQIIIESSTASTALWGEKIAEKLGCKHVCFDFEEIFTNLTQTQLNFMDFKHKRKELCGISVNALPLMFRGYKDVPEEQAYFYRAMCSNPVFDVDGDSKTKTIITELSGYDCVIGTIGRAEKPFLIPTLKGIKEYIESNTDRKFAVLFIGGNAQPKYELEAAAVFKDVENADFYCTGSIFPIPKKLVECCSVFVSSSGSAVATARNGIPTVSVSPSTFGANGILNYTTKFSAVPDKEVNLSIKSQLCEVLGNKYCENHQELGLYGNIPFDKEAEIEYKKQLDFVVKNDAPTQYYDISKIKKEGKPRIITFFSKLLGRKIFLLTLRVLDKSKLTFIKA